MGSIKGLSIDEINMIKNHQITPRDQTIYYFYEKYRTTMTNYLFKKVSSCFKYTVIERKDLISVIWTSTKLALATVDLEQLDCHFLTVVYRMANRQLIKLERSFRTLAHKVLNNAISFDKGTCNNISELGYDDLKNCHLSIDIELFMDKVLKDKPKREQNFIKRLVYLRSYGYTYQQIANKLHAPVRRIFYEISKIQEEGEKFFKP